MKFRQAVYLIASAAMIFVTAFQQDEIMRDRNDLKTLGTIIHSLVVEEVTTAQTDGK